MIRAITVCEKSSPSCGLNRRALVGDDLPDDRQVLKEDLLRGPAVGGRGASMGNGTENPLSGFGSSEDSIGIEGAEGRKPLQERRLEPLERWSRLRDTGTLIPSMGPDRGYFAHRSALCGVERVASL